MKFSKSCVENGKDLQIIYVPLDKKQTVGYKRNAGIERASHDIIMMMDDDDHYPETSLRRRVAWLTRGPWTVDCCVATTIACYDLRTGISFVNSPPLTLGLSKRCSEATLVFYKKFWKAKKFSEENISEGDAFLRGREGSVLELAPQQIIVAFTHSKNLTSRSLPGIKDTKPGCFWGFPREYLEFIHGIEGMKVEEA